MTTNNANFSRLPVNQERDRQPESFTPSRPNSEILTHKPTNEELSGDVELDSLKSAAIAETQESTRLASIRAELSKNQNLGAEIKDLTAQLASTKTEAGLVQTDSTVNTDAVVHVQERSRLIKMLASLFSKKPELSAYSLVNRRKQQLGGIAGAMTGDQNKLMELNGSSAVF
ncbi:hypothetical protein KBB41_01230 [Candidatus Curtissbacteria bacterium]|nr:hypothetical protein [Candidatus Curtissbacteria bacterium]